MVGAENLALSLYNATLEGSAFFSHPDSGCLRISDSDRQDFLQRQTTNDVLALNPEHAVLTVMVSPTARILDILTLIEEDDEILALTLPGHTAATLQYLQKHIFFMDKVQLTDASPDISCIDLEGKQISSTLQHLGFPQTPGINEVFLTKFNNFALKAVGQRGLVGMGARLIVLAGRVQELKSFLLDTGTIQLSPLVYDILRVEAGLPSAGAELTEEYSPLEIGLREAVSDSKGCYPGQEVIARQITYDKITRHLVGLLLDAPLEPKTRLLADSAPAGEITSVVMSPRFGSIALGVVKRPYHEIGTILDVQNEGQIQGARAKVTDLPFRK